MRHADAGTRPHDRELAVIREEDVVLAGAGQQPSDDVGHPVVQLVAEHGGTVVARDAEPVRRRWTAGPGRRTLRLVKWFTYGLFICFHRVS